MIEVNSNVSERKECLQCFSQDRVVRIEIGDEHTKSFHLCDSCSRELYVQLEVMTEGISIKDD